MVSLDGGRPEMHDAGVDASKTRFSVEIRDFDTTSTRLRPDFETTSTRLQGHKLIVYSIIWAEPAKAQAEAWQHHANFMDHTGGPRPEAADPLCGRSHWHGVAMPQPVLLLARLG